MNTIVVLKGYTDLQDRSWSCHSKGEADRLAKWLSDNGHPAMVTTHDGWNQMKDETFSDYPEDWGWK